MDYGTTNDIAARVSLSLAIDTIEVLLYFIHFWKVWYVYHVSYFGGGPIIHDPLIWTPPNWQIPLSFNFENPGKSEIGHKQIDMKSVYLYYVKINTHTIYTLRSIYSAMLSYLQQYWRQGVDRIQ